MQELRGKRRFGVRPQAARINCDVPSFKSTSGRGFSVRRGFGGKAIKLGVLTGCTLAVLWSLAMIADGKFSMGPASAEAASCGTACATAPLAPE